MKPGTTLLHYEIVCPLGQGGMGEVYEVRDSRLNREVALKVLAPQLAGNPTSLARFRREAQAVAAISHPNIVTIHSVEQDADVHFLTMELVRGRTLDRVVPRGGLELGRFFEIALQIVEGLAAAHERGITHRDLKPANVMIGDDGRVRILDFGLAKLDEGPVGDTDPTRVAPLTQEGAIVGTIPYMSPEQVESRPLDHRSDIFSLGVILYEMATGSRPFQGATNPALMSSILRDVPRQVVELRGDLPRHLGRVLHRCLEKEPSDRYRSVRDVAYELGGLQREHASTDGSPPSAPPPDRRPEPEPSATSRSAAGWSSSAPGVERSIAVLPFLNRSSDPDDQYFSDGLSEELINALCRLPGIRVTARGSAFQFRGQELDVREVGRKLGVEALLEGSVRIHGSRLRITAALVNCADGYQLWSERFDGEMTDIFDTQDEIAQAIVRQLEVELGSQGDRPIVARGTENLEAYDLVLRARHHVAGLWEPSVIRALECLERAIELDPNYALAYSQMAFCFLIRSVFGTLEGKDGFPLIRERALRALELDPGSSDAHAMYGVYLLWHDLDWEGAERELLQAIELDPQNVWHRYYYAGLLSTARRCDEILPHVAKMRELDPLNPIIAGHVALYLFYAGRGADAIAAAEQALELYPDYWLLHYEMSFFEWQRRDHARAAACIEKAIELTDGSIPFLHCLHAAILFHRGDRDEGERVLAHVEALAATAPVSATGRVFIEVARGNTAGAIEWLERGRATHDSLFVWIRAFCEQQGMIADERIRETMARLGLP